MAASMFSGSGPVLVCYDGSPESDHALAVALSVLGSHAIILVAAWQSLQTALAESGAIATSIDLDCDDAPGTEGGADAEGRTGALDLLTAAAKRARTAGHPVSTRTAQAQGPVWQTLLAVADEVDAVLIVTGTHGRGTLTSAVLGSVSRELIAHSGRPVLVVPNRT